MAVLRFFQTLFILFALHSCIVSSQETEDKIVDVDNGDAEEEKVSTDVPDDEEIDDTEEKKESAEDESEPDITVEKKDVGLSTDLCSLPELENLVDLLMAEVNSRIPITYELRDRQLRTMTISDISVSNLNSMVRYRASAITCPGEGKVILTIPLRSLRPIIAFLSWGLHFPRGIGGKVTISLADFDADAVVALEIEPDQKVQAKLIDLKVMRLEGISIQTSGYGGLIGRISDQLTTLLVSNFRGLFRNFVQSELSKIIADEMLQIPFAVSKKAGFENELNL